MAIKAKVETIQGVILETAYINIQNPQIQKIKSEGVNSYKVGANACVYASKDAYNTGKIPVEGFSVICDLDLTKNVLEQLYLELKLNPRLEDIVDLDTITLIKEEVK